MEENSTWTFLEIVHHLEDGCGYVPNTPAPQYFAFTTDRFLALINGEWICLSDSEDLDIRNGYFYPEQLLYNNIASQVGHNPPRLPEKYGVSRRMVLDPYQLSHVVYNLGYSRPFRTSCAKFIRERPTTRDRQQGQSACITLCLDETAFVHKFDEAWENRIWTLCMWNELVKEHLAWLSTLGGAFSALGKIGFKAFAERAGKISISQLRLALRLGDPILSSRSRIYFALSLIQQRSFRMARRILRNERRFARSEAARSEADKLESIVDSVWQYLLWEEKQNKYSAKQKKKLEARADRLLFDDETMRSKATIADTILAMSRLDFAQKA
ncbi:hypothetical protein RvY_15576 [Ramazzottius varieornatus]|uniref:Uncharacterized protein n=1 Tax=Ramazzottius varieornatus TaxID=947166 RepID=A0A1D1VVD9_RAMVA|nr:hypothetical protein RvY_15576 [Ramazzottius varieornatus]